MCVPLRSKGRVLGVINMSHVDGCDYTAADLQLLGALAAQAASAMENAILHERRMRQERIRGHLERYVPSQVIDLILQDPDHVSLASESRHIALLFSDIRNFSSTCERLAAEEVVEHLNRYFSAMVEEIFENRGTVNKFVGDMIVALFGAPVEIENPEQAAVRAAVAMQERLRRVEDPWIRNRFHTGVGLSSGSVVVGNIGSPRHMDYTAIGDEVNVAARLQSLARGGQVLVSRRVREAAGDRFRFRPLGAFRVKGRQRPVEAYEVVY
jgi:class 3 adenylate cyclase